MTKIVTILAAVLVLTSCSNTSIVDADEYMSNVVELQSYQLIRLHHIERSTKDTNVLKYINLVKDTLKMQAYRTQGMLSLKNEGPYIEFKKTKEGLRIYIDSLNQK